MSELLLKTPPSSASGSGTESGGDGGHGFGTFNGVFLPSILTMLGAIMFLRVNFITGSAGIASTLIILFAGASIVFATALSISAISSNTPVKGGGVYFLISRTLGPGFGGSIGLTLFLAQGISIPFNILGFTEALCADYPSLSPLYFTMSVLTGIVLLGIAFSGADWAMKAQFVIFISLILGILTMYAGAGLHFRLNELSANWHPAAGPVRYGLLFALFFPALTGIMAGVNMSGDLKNPGRSIPTGIIWTIIVGVLLYGIEIILCGAAYSRESLIEEPYKILVRSAPFGASFLLTLGVAAATLSTALGLFVCAPRVLQALANDNIIPMLSVLGRGRGKHHEPFHATLLLGVIVVAVLIAASWGGLSPGGMSKGMNLVAEIATMCFLLTYTMVNLAAFVESYGANPSFRPRFKFFHWSVALYGFVACLGVSFYINFLAASVALLLAWLLFFYIKHRKFSVAFGDARRGFLYSRIRENLLALSRIPADPKNWRPTIAILSGKPEEHLYMPYFATGMESDRGIISMVKFVERARESQEMHYRDAELSRLRRLLWEENGYESVFPELVLCVDYDKALRVFLQAHLIGPLKPNIVMMNYPENPERVRANIRHIQTITGLKMSCMLMMNFASFELPRRTLRGTIDIWWRGVQNISIMLILANLLIQTPHWQGVRLRLLRVAPPGEDTSHLADEMKRILESARIEAETEMIFSDRPFREVMRETSADAVALFLGFILLHGEEDTEKNEEIFTRFSDYLAGMPPAFLVTSSGGADLRA